ncbi:MAG TPA: hypothetical protein VMY59_00020 [Candidatus Thermoplasmatota archaeon]|nr:hypothetical protein [Candidatus Thermoplasmatota archaeon]
MKKNPCRFARLGICKNCDGRQDHCKSDMLAANYDGPGLPKQCFVYMMSFASYLKR